SRDQSAPGAEEFRAPSSIGVWLPPERTFSPLTNRGFTPERVDQFEGGVEHEFQGGVTVGVRAFHQRINDQMITLFGVTLPRSAASDVGHYYVASAGDASAQGWGVNVSRTVAG